MITREADYAIRVILYLSDIDSGTTVSTSMMAEEIMVPYRFLRKINRRLAEAGIIGTSRGKSGGIFLNRKPGEISLYDVISVFDSRSISLNCCDDEDGKCPRRDSCTVHFRLNEVQRELDNLLKGADFEQLRTKKAEG